MAGSGPRAGSAGARSGGAGSGAAGSAAAGGYSATPLAKKLGIKAGHRVRLQGAPDGWDIPGLPDDCDLAAGGPRGADVVVAFHRAYATLTGEAAGLVEDLADHAALWIAWPRRAAGHVSDITENGLREVFLPLGVVDVKVAALGEDWSGLKFVRRKENRRR
ncbi:DUF3052 domain-containing protein [Streptomyces griseorubiginosus]|uniref:DUF3052 domain-containing protein n=1 Tax=Streptomyces griseorubiginosus TaxID=67304 RepID=UPI0036E726FE